MGSKAVSLWCLCRHGPSKYPLSKYDELSFSEPGSVEICKAMCPRPPVNKTFFYVAKTC